MTGSRVSEPISVKSKSNAGRHILYIMGGLFFLVGLGVLIGVFAPKLMAYISAGDWVRTECVIKESEAQSHSSDDGTMYRPHFRYTYYFDGKEYTSDQYSFFNSSTRNYDAVADLVAAHPVGSQGLCYVNPENPDQAVINRDLSLEFLFLVLPLGFMAFGGGLLYTATRVSGKDGSPKGHMASHALIFQDKVTPGLPDPVNEGQALKLNPRQSRLGGALFLLLFTIIWNVIVSIFLFQVVNSWLSGNPNYFETLFLIPFVLVGIGVLLLTIRQFMTLLNPSVSVRLSPNRPVLGGAIDIQWQMKGSVRAVKELEVVMEGREVAKYTQGTSTYTDTHIFHSTRLYNSSRSLGIRMGHASFNVPADTMHTFIAEHNQIMWVLVFRGGISLGPDLDDEFEIPVFPK
jgi:hypothetical protein